jgi:uncharacterized protein YqgV (UPF0045/DUF77 family)
LPQRQRLSWASIESEEFDEFSIAEIENHFQLRLSSHPGFPGLNIAQNPLFPQKEARMISAQISVYPLRQEHLGPAIEVVKNALEAHGLHPTIGAMSTLVTGETEIVFAALQAAFSQAAATGQVVMTVTFSNACPV